MDKQPLEAVRVEALHRKKARATGTMRAEAEVVGIKIDYMLKCIDGEQRS